MPPARTAGPRTSFSGVEAQGFPALSEAEGSPAKKKWRRAPADVQHHPQQVFESLRQSEEFCLQLWQGIDAVVRGRLRLKIGRFFYFPYKYAR